MVRGLGGLSSVLFVGSVVESGLVEGVVVDSGLGEGVVVDAGLVGGVVVDVGLVEYVVIDCGLVGVIGDEGVVNKGVVGEDLAGSVVVVCFEKDVDAGGDVMGGLDVMGEIDGIGGLDVIVEVLVKVVLEDVNSCLFDCFGVDVAFEPVVFKLVARAGVDFVVGGLTLTPASVFSWFTRTLEVEVVLS